MTNKIPLKYLHQTPIEYLDEIIENSVTDRIGYYHTSSSESTRGQEIEMQIKLGAMDLQDGKISLNDYQTFISMTGAAAKIYQNLGFSLEIIRDVNDLKNWFFRTLGAYYYPYQN